MSPHALQPRSKVGPTSVSDSAILVRFNHRWLGNAFKCGRKAAATSGGDNTRTPQRRPCRNGLCVAGRGGSLQPSNCYKANCIMS